MYDNQKLFSDPFDQFRNWYRRAFLLRNVMTLATSTLDGVPSARIVLFKGVDQSGFRFFGNYESRKGRELARNPRAALVFFWPLFFRQVRIEGVVEMLASGDSDCYFAFRSRGSQLGAWASPQSQEIPDRDFLEKSISEAAEKFRGRDVERPPFWGGYRLVPNRIEFWQGRRHRVHDRYLYLKEDNTWAMHRLAP